MDLYCIKHKKKLAERYDSLHKRIESYCVYCEMEHKYEDQMHSRTEARREIMRKLSFKAWVMAVGAVIFILLIPLHTLLKVLFVLIMVGFIIRAVFEPFLTLPPHKRRPDWDDIRAKALNQSSIQANEVDNVKRQWKKGFLQVKKNQKWTEEDWQEHLKRYYKKD